MRNRPGPRQEDVGPPPGRTHQGSPPRSRPSHVSQPEAINAIMQITLDTKPYAALETDALVSYVFDDTDPIQGTLAEIDKSVNGLLRKLSAGAEFTGKPLEMTLIHAPSGLKATRLLLVGAGKRDKFDVSTLRKIAGTALRYLKSRSVKQLAFLVRENDLNEHSAQAIAEGAITADFETDKYKSDHKNDKSIDTVVIAGYSDKDKSAGEKGLTAAASSPKPKISPATSSTNLPTSSPPKSWPKKPKPWPKNPAYRQTSSTKSASPTLKWALSSA